MPARSSDPRRRGSSSVLSAAGEGASVSRAAKQRVVLGLLRSSGGVVDIEGISESMLVPRSVVGEVLSMLGLREGAAIPEDTLADLAIRLLEERRSYEEVSKSLSWQLFEAVAARLLEARGMRVLHNLHLKHRGRRVQIDILAYSENAVYIIECKRWLRGVSSSDVRRVAPILSRRCDALAEALERELGRGERRVVLVPLILSVYGEPYIGEAFHSPLRLLRSFLEEHPLALPSPPSRRLGLERGLGGLGLRRLLGTSKTPDGRLAGFLGEDLRRL